ncbi:hypothetical protein [Streptomyces massasporeus]|uniref:hypothetical protein n=1 Tax=Streptomyces massasporeus TaxID=67324 RepID=UPI003822FDD1
MRDAMVLKAQRFVNSVYGSRTGTTVQETGEADWATLYALTRALQYELGITAFSDNFGPTTLNTLTAKYPKLDADTVPSPDFCRIVQSGLYCKGYDGGDRHRRTPGRPAAGPGRGADPRLAAGSGSRCGNPRERAVGRPAQGGPGTGAPPAHRGMTSV